MLSFESQEQAEKYFKSECSSFAVIRFAYCDDALAMREYINARSPTFCGEEDHLIKVNGRLALCGSKEPV